MAGQQQLLIIDPSGKLHYCIDSNCLWSTQCGDKIYDCENEHISGCYFNPIGQMFRIIGDEYQNIDRLFNSGMSQIEFAQVARLIFGDYVRASMTKETFKLNPTNGELLPLSFPSLDALMIFRTDYEIEASNRTWRIRFSKFENQPPCFCRADADHTKGCDRVGDLQPLWCMTTPTYRRLMNVMELTNTRNLPLPKFIVFEDSEKRRGGKIVFDALMPSGEGEVKAELVSGSSLRLSDLRVVRHRGPHAHVLPFISKSNFDGKAYFAFQNYEIALSEIRWEEHTLTQKIKIFEDIVLGLSELADSGLEDVELSSESVVNKHGHWLLYGLKVIVPPRSQALFNLGNIILAGVGSHVLQGNDPHLPELRHLASSLSARRLDAFQAKQHPVFRTEIKKLRFLCNLSDVLLSDIVLRDDLEKSSHLVYGSVEVGLVLHPDLIRAMHERVDYRRFGFNTVQALLRLMRNIEHHLEKLLERKPHLRSLFETKDELYNYFNERYPCLFIEAFEVVYDRMGFEYTNKLFEVQEKDEARDGAV